MPRPIAHRVPRVACAVVAAATLAAACPGGDARARTARNGRVSEQDTGPPRARAVLSSVESDSAPTLTLRVLDVTDSRIGGLAVLITLSSGGFTRSVLVDGGETSAAPALRRLAVDSLALVVLTHPHADHYGGLTDVLRTLPVRAFAFGGDTRTLASYRRLLEAVSRSGARPIVVGDTTRTVRLSSAADSLSFVLLPAPPPSWRAPGDAVNNRSVGVVVRYGRFSALIPGDAERPEEAWWAGRYPELLDADVLVASHHGSADANDTRTASRWYRTVTPRLLLISANGVQHPYAEVLRFAAAQGVPTYCTSTAGTIAVRATLDGRWRVSPERAAPCRPGSERPR